MKNKKNTEIFMEEIESIQSIDYSFYEYTSEIDKNVYIESDCFFSNNNITKNHVISYDVVSERKEWNNTLTSSIEKNESVSKLLLKLFESINNYDDDYLKKRYEKFLKKTEFVFNSYNSESENYENKKFKTPSRYSLMQLVRFIPEYPMNNLSVYLEESTGFFGITIKQYSKEMPVLNLLMKDNKEVVFSFIKRKNGIIKISGRSYFNENLEDSDEIGNILRMIR